MKTIEAQLPDQLYAETLSLVHKGWFRDEQDILLEALRRYLDAHRPELMEQFVREDIEWGLYGDE
jgi:Arc/MetJ-type ribon-helix-helix transcriptional regulator